MRRLTAIMAIAIIAALTSCEISPGGSAMYHEMLTTGLNEGTYAAYSGYGSSRQLVLLTVTGDHAAEDAAVTLSFYQKDLFGDGYETEPFAVYSGTYRHRRTETERWPMSDWTSTDCVDEFWFTACEGDGQYTLDDLSGAALISYPPDTALNIDENDWSMTLVPVTGTRISIERTGGSYDDITALTAFTFTKR